MRKVIVWLSICIMLVLTACNHKKKEPVIEPPTEPAAEEEEKTAVDERCLETIEKAAYIHLGDVVEDSYQGSIDCELDQEDIKALKEMKDELVMKNKPSVSFYYYKLTIYDKNMEVLDTWTVDINYRIEAGLGYGIEGEGKLQELLESVEEKNDITFGKICDRPPGKNYLEMLDQASGINLVEITKNNFIEGVDYYLKRGEVEELKRVRAELNFGDIRKDLNEYHYQIHIYTESGAELYFWIVDFNGKVYDNGYELKGEGLTNWLNNIEEKSGLTEKRKKSSNK